MKKMKAAPAAIDLGGVLSQLLQTFGPLALQFLQQLLSGRRAMAFSIGGANIDLKALAKKLLTVLLQELLPAVAAL